MRWRWFVALGAPALLAALLVAAAAAAVQGGQEQASARLSGYPEVPPVSTTGSGECRARLASADTLEFMLSYSGPEGTATAARIHRERARGQAPARPAAPNAAGYRP